MLHLKVDINKNILISNTEYKIRLRIHVSDKIKIEHNWILFVCNIKKCLKIHSALPGVHVIIQFIVSEFDTFCFVYAKLHCVNYQKMFIIIKWSQFNMVFL